MPTIKKTVCSHCGRKISLFDKIFNVAVKHNNEWVHPSCAANDLIDKFVSSVNSKLHNPYYIDHLKLLQSIDALKLRRGDDNLIIVVMDPKSYSNFLANPDIRRNLTRQGGKSDMQILELFYGCRIEVDSNIVGIYVKKLQPTETKEPSKVSKKRATKYKRKATVA